MTITYGRTLASEARSGKRLRQFVPRGLKRCEGSARSRLGLTVLEFLGTVTAAMALGMTIAWPVARFLTASRRTYLATRSSPKAPAAAPNSTSTSSGPGANTVCRSRPSACTVRG